MLPDFVEDVLRDLEKARSHELEKLVAAAADQHDLIRGRYLGLDDAITRVKGHFKRYSGPSSDDEPPTAIVSRRLTPSRAPQGRLVA